MKFIKAGYEILDELNGNDILRKIELCGRVCYKSEESITADSAIKFVKDILIRGHEAVIEHANISVRFIVDRGISHEIVRHRIASYCQESTRYCNYEKDDSVTLILPEWLPPSFLSEWNKKREYNWTSLLDSLETNDHRAYIHSCVEAEEAYLELIRAGWSPQQARSVLPNSLKTELIMTANLREWRHFLKLRTAKAAHPQMREVAIPLLHELQTKIPVIFDDIEA